MAHGDSTVAGERASTARIDLRAVWVQIHLWLGLTLGVLGAVLGVSGSLLVYDHAIDAWLNPARYRISGATVALPYAEYAQRAASAVGQGARALNIRLPDGEAKPVVVFARPRGEAAVIRRVYLDPATGRVLDAPAGRGLIAWAHDVHGSLLLREYNGRDIVGVVGVAMLISSLSGIYLWWPRRRFGARDFGFRHGFTRSRNLHYTFGFYSSLVLAMLAFTGIAISFPEAARSAVAVFGKRSESPRNFQATPAAGGKSISMDRAADVARELYPNATVIGVGAPSGPGGTFRVALREAGDDGPRPVTQVLIDPISGAVLRTVDRAGQTPGDAFLAYQRPLHEGATLGAIGRSAIFVVGFLPALFVVTGSMIWLRGRRARRRIIAIPDLTPPREEAA